MSEPVALPPPVETAARARRGQSLVEFALIAPLLFLLLGGAVDFGRVFFSWVQLTNSARVGANYAANHPTAWGAPGNPAQQDDYAQAISQEASGIHCQLPASLPSPQFPGGKAIGADARVELSCTFSLITPFMGDVIHDPLVIKAQATFPIQSGCVGCPPAPTPTPQPTPTPTPTPTPCAIVPNTVGMTVSSARSTWTANGFTGLFMPANAPAANIVATQSTNPGSSPGDCLVITASITVTSTAPPPPTCGVVPDLYGTLVQTARNAWTAAGFMGAFVPTNNNSATVLGQTTNPASVPGDCIPFTATMTVTYGAAPTPVPTPTPAPCSVPSFVGTPSGNGGATATATWHGAGFSSNVKFKKPGQLPYTIQVQSLVGGSLVPCSSAIELGP